MSNRYIPYGYKFEGGQPVPHPGESQIVREIFDRYSTGDSLKLIADDLTHRRVEYSPGKTSWDKARIKRILENSRYIGSNDYPALVDNEIFVAANLKREQTNTNKLTIDDDTKLFKELTVCAKCGKKVTRRTDSRFADPVSWKCAECGWSVRLSDEGFKDQIVNIMNTLITNPDIAVPDEPPPETIDLESKRLLNEFHRALDSGKASESELIKMVLQIGAANYQAIDSREAVTARLVADLTKAEPSPDFQRELFQRTARRIHMSADGTLSIELQNRKIVTERTE
nr:recombinase family protein [Acutalibacter muris]